MNRLTTIDKINSTFQNVRIPSLVLAGFLVSLAVLLFFVNPIWPIISLMGSMVLIYCGMLVHYYYEGPWAYTTPYGLKVWWSKGIEPLYPNYVDSRVLSIINNFCKKASLNDEVRSRFIEKIFRIKIYVKNDNIHGLSNVIGLTYPGISSTFKSTYFDMALNHEINLHLCHFLYPGRSEEEDVKWMVERGIE